MICSKCHKTAPDAPYCCWCGASQDTTKKPNRTRGNGQGTVFKRGKTWTARITVWRYESDSSGKINRIRRYKSKGGFTTKKAALAYLATMTDKTERQSPKLIELWEQYSNNAMAKLSVNKQTAYNIARKRLDDIIDRRIDDITTSDLQNVVNQNASSYYTARDMKSVLSHMYQIAIQDSYVQSNLSQYIVLPSLDEKESEPFTAAEVDIMWEAYAQGNTFVGYLLLMIYSGMMPGELMDCKKYMIDFDRCEINGCGKKTKTRKSTNIVFAECVKPVLEELCELSDKDNLQPMGRNQWYDKYHATLKELGIRDLPPYACRHTTGTEAAKQNLNAATIQKIMRHSKISTSQRYIHFGSDEAHAGLNSI